MANDFQIDGLRIYLRSLTPADANETYARWMADPEVTRFLESRFATHTVPAIAQYIQETNQSGVNHLAGIFLRNTHQHIGNIKIGPINPHHHFAELGLLIGAKECWGKGYASEAIALFTDYAFKQWGLHKVVAGAYADNQGSIKAFLKAGYEQEGVLRDHWLCDGKYQDGVILARRAPR